MKFVRGNPSRVGVISVAILLICRQSIVAGESAEVGESSHETHDAGGEAGGEHESHDGLVKGHGETCGGDDGGHCDLNVGLVCVEDKCECDQGKGEAWKDGKCEVEIVAEVDNVLEEGESEGGEENVHHVEETPEEHHENHEETGGEHHDHVEETHAGVHETGGDHEHGQGNEEESPAGHEEHENPEETHVAHGNPEETHEENGHQEESHVGHEDIHAGHHPEETTTTSTTPAPVAVPDASEEKEAEEPIATQENHEDNHEHHHHEITNEHGHSDHSEHTDHDTMDHDHSPAVIGSEGKCANVNCVETLGHYSKCDEETGECKCSDVDGLDRPTIISDSVCHIKRSINSPCTEHEECSATISGKAWCHMDTVTHDRFCQCEMFHYYDEVNSECLQFADNGISSSCKTDLQCTGIDKKISGHGLGPNAQCNQEKRNCECKLGPNGQKAFLYENYCYYQLLPGDSCTLDRECQMSFPGQDVTCLNGGCYCSSGENITAVSCPLDPNDASNLLGEPRVIEDDVVSAGLDYSNLVYIMIIGAVVLLGLVVLSILIVKKRHKYSVVKTREPQDEPDSPL